MKYAMMVIWGSFIALLILLFLSRCATPGQGPGPQACEQYAALRSAELTRSGYQLIDAGMGLNADGVVMFGKFLNPSQGSILLDVLVDTEVQLDLAVKSGFVAAGTCDRGGHTWYVIRKAMRLQPKVRAPGVATEGEAGQ